MTNKNVRIWNKLKRPPETALRTITGGNLAGKTDINPQWRMEAMTAAFGPCGLGWKYTIDEVWNEPGPGGCVFAFAKVNVYYREDYESPWSEAVPGVGGNQLVKIQKKGPFPEDEAYKMAITDALSVAMKAIGVGADIYAGMWDGSRYNDPEPPIEVEVEDTSEEVEARIEEYEKRIREAKNIQELNIIGYELVDSENPDSKVIGDAVRDLYQSKKREINTRTNHNE
jgi:hypothetical protein